LDACSPALRALSSPEPGAASTEPARPRGLTPRAPPLGCAPPLPPTPPPTRPPRSSRTPAQRPRARAEHLLALFAWHRDGPLVARSLGLSLDELHEQLDELKLRRKAYRLTRGSEFDMPAARALAGAPSGPPVR